MSMCYKQINIIPGGGEGGREAGNQQLSTITIKVMKVVSRMKYLLSFQLILARIVYKLAFQTVQKQNLDYDGSAIR